MHHQISAPQTPADNARPVQMTTTVAVRGEKRPATRAHDWHYDGTTFPAGQHRPWELAGDLADVYCRDNGVFGGDLDLYKPQKRAAWESSAWREHLVQAHGYADSRPYVKRGTAGSMRLLVVMTGEQAAEWWPVGSGLDWGEIRSAGLQPSPGAAHPSGDTYEHVPGPDRVRYPDGTELLTNVIRFCEGCKAALIADGAHGQDDRPMVTGDAGLPDDDGRCSGKAFAWFRDARLDDSTSPLGITAYDAVNFLKRCAAEGHLIGGYIDEVIEALPHTSPADFEDMWARALVPADIVALPHECCPDDEPGLKLPAAAIARIEANGQQPATMNGQGPGPDGEAGWSGQVDVENAARAGRELRGELGRGRLAGLYLRDGMLVHTPRTGEDGYIMPTPDEAARGIDHGPAQVRQVDTGHLRALVEVKFSVYKPVRDARTRAITGFSEALFPADAARHAAGAAELGTGCPNLAQLAGITHTPVIRPDGTVLDSPGYDQATGLLYLPAAGLAVPPVPAEPTAAQVRAAVELMRHPVSLFPWVAKHHEANWLGAMLTPLLRLRLPPPYPMVIITATNAGSGKGYLMRLLGIVHGITTRGEFPRDRDELRKLIISTLHTTTAPVVGLDNIRGTIYSSELEALLTARTLTDRELGASRNITVTNDRLWVATGNNARIAGDLARRCLPVAIDPGCADPHKRAFPFSPVEWMTAHRGEYTAALLTVIRGWVLAGAPGADPGRSDDYAAWYGALRGLLAWAGIPGTFGAEDDGDLSAVSEDDAEWRAFVRQLATTFGAGWFTAREVISGLQAELGHQPGYSGEGTPLADALPGDLADKWEQARYGKTAGITRSLSKWLSYRDGRYTADGLTVRAARGAHRATYRIDWPDEERAG